ncbi:MAG: class I SAM-dependent methyltransferase [Thermogutta sp.]
MSWWKRIWGGLVGHPPATLEATLDRLVSHLRQWEERARPGPPILFAAGWSMATLMNFGVRDAAWTVGRWLQSLQQADGTLTESRAPEPVFLATAAAARGWLSALPDLPEFESPAQAACQALRRWITDEGRVLPPRGRDWNYEPESLWHDPPDLTPLLLAGRRWPDTDWTSAGIRAVEYWLSHGHRRHPAERSSSLIRRARLYSEWSRRNEAGQTLQEVESRQTASGAIPERPGEANVLTATVLEAAGLWFQYLRPEYGDAALRFAERRRLPSGGFPRHLAGENAGDREEDPLAAKLFLDAVQAEVRCEYQLQLRGTGEESLDSEDPRLQLVARFAQPFAEGAVIADLGCGTGRYLRILAPRFPHLHWTGIDFIPEALHRLPHGIRAVEGSLLRIPLPERSFHGGFCVDALSHSLLPRHAIAEICRVIRPGGRILIIEPTALPQGSGGKRQQPLSADALAEWLKPYCANLTFGELTVHQGMMKRTAYLSAFAERKG